MEGKPKTEWTGNAKIAELLDVLTAACSRCGGPARVPEDVAAVMKEPGKRAVPFVVCPACSDAFMAEMRESSDAEIRRRIEEAIGGDDVEE